MDLGLDGKVALVTGASKGIGYAAAAALAAEGATVIGVGRTAPQTPSPGVDYRQGDLATEGVPARLVAEVAAEFGGLDVLVNNAAIARVVSGFEAEGLDAWRQTIAVNLLAAVEATQAALPHLVARGGAIVNVSSVNAKMPASEGPSYSASKAALVNLTKAIATEFAGRVRANVVSPGLTATPMWLGDAGIAAQFATLTGAPADDVAKGAADGTPLKRFLDPAEVAAAICFLASPAASAITGTELVVDGGLTPTI